VLPTAAWIFSVTPLVPNRILSFLRGDKRLRFPVIVPFLVIVTSAGAAGAQPPAGAPYALIDDSRRD